MKMVIVRCGNRENAAGLVVREGHPLFERIMANKEEQAQEVETTNVPVRLS